MNRDIIRQYHSVFVSKATGFARSIGNAVATLVLLPTSNQVTNLSPTRFMQRKEVAKDRKVAKRARMSGISGVNANDDPKGRACGFCEARKGHRLNNCPEEAKLKREWSMT